ncbi:unnamed protein product [Ilex paraguariensis]|uniref:Uncharacterized protein n=1 Tax=Ilex paraguariensis TaxID=185542 RepID=A0ABC8S9R0_9AQUA
MATSSKTVKDCDMLREIEGDERETEEEEEEGEGEKEKEQAEERDCLELSLGFGTACGKLLGHGSNSSSASFASPSSSFPSQQAQKQSGSWLGLGVGLGLGFENMGASEKGVGSSSKYHRFWCEHYRGLAHDDHDGMPSPSSSSLTLCPPPSLSLWPLHVASTSFLGLHGLLVPVPADTHHYTQRPQSGLWFTLRSLINREGEGLPQVPKAYIRVKDENVTIFMVKTYLVTKLGLPNESEIDISCMGEKLLQSETLKHVRDHIWLPRLVESVNSETTSIENYNDMSVNHLMPLDYGRRLLN